MDVVKRIVCTKQTKTEGTYWVRNIIARKRTRATLRLQRGSRLGWDTKPERSKASSRYTAEVLATARNNFSRWPSPNIFLVAV